jgi:hypothetical protein
MARFLPFGFTDENLVAAPLHAFDECQGLLLSEANNENGFEECQDRKGHFVLSRRILCCAGACVGITSVIAVATFGWPDVLRNRDSRDAPQPPRIVVLYVGAEDCAPCRTWQRGAKVAFQASPEFQRLVYREVKSPTLFDLPKDENWPEDLREYRSQLGRDAGVPLWLVIADGQVVQRGMGPTQWSAEVVPKIRSLLRRT